LLSSHELWEITIEQVIRVLKPNKDVEWLPATIWTFKNNSLALRSNGRGTVTQLGIVAVNVRVQQIAHFLADCTFQNDWTEEHNSIAKVLVNPPIAVDVMSTISTLARYDEYRIEVFGCFDLHSRTGIHVTMRPRAVAIEYNSR